MWFIGNKMTMHTEQLCHGIFLIKRKVLEKWGGGLVSELTVWLTNEKNGIKLLNASKL